MKWLTGAKLAVIASGLLLIVFYSWYGSGSSAISREEQQSYNQRFEKLSDSVTSFVKPQELQAFMASDDGKPFYVVNLFKFNERASYNEERENSKSGYEAFQQFSREVIPIWLKRGGHPVFASQVNEHFSNEWDLVSVVRYRSRRDFIDMQLDENFHKILPHRLAATDSNIRLKLPGIAVPSPFLALLLIWAMSIILCVLTQTLWRARTHR